MIDRNGQRMTGGDAADRKEASYWPEHEDRPEDIWAQDFTDMCKSAELAVCPDFVKIGKAALVKVLSVTDSDGYRMAQREAVVRFLKQARDFDACPDLQYFVACWQAAFELEDKDEDKTQTAIARTFKVTRAAVSKRVVDIRKAANEKTKARSQKSIASRKVYALRQLIVGQTRKRIDLSNQQKETAILWEMN